MRVMHGRKDEKGQGATSTKFTAFPTCLISYFFVKNIRVA